jgi:hypothetical protein
MERSDELNVEEQEAGLERSRARLRRELLPAGDPDRFPRSAVMRAVFDPRAQKVLMLALSAVAMLAARPHRKRRGGLAARVSDLTRHLNHGAWR